jgi:hypothetical protein
MQCPSQEEALDDSLYLSLSLTLSKPTINRSRKKMAPARASSGKSDKSEFRMLLEQTSAPLMTEGRVRVHKSGVPIMCFPRLRSMPGCGRAESHGDSFSVTVQGFSIRAPRKLILQFERATTNLWPHFAKLESLFGESATFDKSTLVDKYLVDMGKGRRTWVYIHAAVTPNPPSTSSNESSSSSTSSFMVDVDDDVDNMSTSHEAQSVRSSCSSSDSSSSSSDGCASASSPASSSSSRSASLSDWMNMEERRREVDVMVDECYAFSADNILKTRQQGLSAQLCEVDAKIDDCHSFSAENILKAREQMLAMFQTHFNVLP